MKKATIPAAAACVLLLAGCAAGPSHEEVAERFAIELASGIGEPPDWVDLADDLATDAMNGRCGSDEYGEGLASQATLAYAWAATCLMYFEGDMTADQQEHAKSLIVGAAIDDLD